MEEFSMVRKDNLIMLLQCSIRYALGRGNFVAKDVVEMVLRHQERLPRAAMHVIIDDVRKTIRSRARPPEMLLPIWEQLLTELEKTHGRTEER